MENIFDELKNSGRNKRCCYAFECTKEIIYNKIITVFDDLRKIIYDGSSKQNTKERITQLTKILKGLNDSIDRDNEKLPAAGEKDATLHGENYRQVVPNNALGTS